VIGDCECECALLVMVGTSGVVIDMTCVVTGDLLFMFAIGRLRMVAVTGDW